MTKLTANEVARTAYPLSLTFDGEKYEPAQANATCPGCKRQHCEPHHDPESIAPFSGYWTKSKFKAYCCDFCGAVWSHRATVTDEDKRKAREAYEKSRFATSEA